MRGNDRGREGAAAAPRRQQPAGRGNYGRGSGQEILTTFFACRPFGPSTTSKETRSPSFRVRNPSAMIEAWWTNTSAPRSRTMNPYPLASLNHFTVPCSGILLLLETGCYWSPRSGRHVSPTSTPDSQGEDNSIDPAQTAIEAWLGTRVRFSSSSAQPHESQTFRVVSAE